MVQAGVNGHQTPQPQRPESRRGISEARTEATPPVVKTETSAISPVAADSVRVASAGAEAKPSTHQGSMPPPMRIPSATPHPAVSPAAQPVAHVAPLVPAPVTFAETFSRTRPISEALLPTIRLSSHPQLSVSKPFNMSISASPEYTQQSITIMLPPSQYYLQASPVVSQQLASGRQYKLFVTVNGTRVSPSMRPMVNGDLTNGVERKQAYDVPLNPGVNRIEIEIVAVTGRGTGALEVEKTTVFANLMRY